MNILTYILDFFTIKLPLCTIWLACQCVTPHWARCAIVVQNWGRPQADYLLWWTNLANFIMFIKLLFWWHAIQFNKTNLLFLGLLRIAIWFIKFNWKKIGSMIPWIFKEFPPIYHFSNMNEGVFRVNDRLQMCLLWSKIEANLHTMGPNCQEWNLY